MSDTIYIKFDQQISVENADVRLGDMGDIWCRNPSVQNHCRSLRLMKMKEIRTWISVLDVIRLIGETFPDAEISNLGESDVLLELTKETGQNRWWEWMKFLLIWLVIFIGAAFAIATFNEDVSVASLFEKIHAGITGQERTGITWLEGGYAAGMLIGILIFYNHFSIKKEMDDPTPLEVEMRTYEKELYSAQIDDRKRQKQKQKE